MTTHCQDIQDKLSPLLDGSLEVAEAHQVRRHLETCTACRRQERLLRQTVEAVASLPRVPVPDDFRHSIRARLHDEALVSSTRSFYRRALALAASVALAVGLGLGMALAGFLPSDGPQALRSADADTTAPFRNPPASRLTDSETRPVSTSRGYREALDMVRDQPGAPGQNARQPLYLGATEAAQVPRDYYLTSADEGAETTRPLPAVVRVSF